MARRGFIDGEDVGAPNWLDGFEPAVVPEMSRLPEIWMRKCVSQLRADTFQAKITAMQLLCGYFTGGQGGARRPSDAVLALVQDEVLSMVQTEGRPMWPTLSRLIVDMLHYSGNVHPVFSILPCLLSWAVDPRCAVRLRTAVFYILRSCESHNREVLKVVCNVLSEDSSLVPREVAHEALLTGLDQLSRGIPLGAGDADLLVRSVLMYIDQQTQPVGFGETNISGVMMICGDSIEISSKAWRKHAIQAAVVLLNVLKRAIDAEYLEERLAAVHPLSLLIEHFPSKFNKEPTIVACCVALFLHLVAEEQTDDATWETASSEGGLEGEQSLDRMANALKGRVMLPIVLEFLQKLCVSTPNHKVAALLCISEIAEGCATELRTHLPTVARIIQSAFEDECVRVRYAACQALGQLATDFGPDFLNPHTIDGVFAVLIRTMKEETCDKMRAHGAAAVINVCAYTEEDLLLARVPGLMECLVDVLRSAGALTQEHTLTAIAAVAEAIGESFAPYVGSMLNMLDQILRTMVEGEEDVQHARRRLQAKAIEAISVVAVSAPKAIGKNPAHVEMMRRTMSAIHNIPRDATDARVAYVSTFWARMCKCLPGEVAPYMDGMVEDLLATLANPMAGVMEPMEDDAAVGDEVLRVGNQNFRLNSDVLLQRQDAYLALLNAMETLPPEKLFGHLEALVHIVEQGLSFVVDEVRATAMVMVVALMKLTQDKPNIQTQILWQVLDPLSQALVQSSDDLVTMHEVIKLAHVDTLRRCGVARILTEVCLQCQQGLVEIGEYSEEEPADIHTEACNAYLESCIALGCFVQKVPEFVTEMDHLMEQLQDADPVIRVGATYILCDILDYVTIPDYKLASGVPLPESYFAEDAPTPPSSKFVELAQDMFLDSLNVTSTAIKQSACFGIGLLLKGYAHTGRVNVEACLAGLTATASLQYVPEDRLFVQVVEGNLTLTKDNATSSIIRAMQNPAVDRAVLVRAVLDGHQIKEDMEEANCAGHALLALVQTNDPNVLGEGMANVPRLAALLVDLATLGGDAELRSEVESMCSIAESMLIEVWGQANYTARLARLAEYCPEDGSDAE